MRRLALLGAVLGGMASLGGCSAMDEVAGDCIILTNGGNKLCGEDAKAWCEGTEEFRQGDPVLGLEADTESQAVCDGL